MATIFVVQGKYGTSTATVNNVSGFTSIYMIGPSASGSINARGMYIRSSVSGTAPNQTITYRWDHDQNTPGSGVLGTDHGGVANPTTYTGHGC